MKQNVMIVMVATSVLCACSSAPRSIVQGPVTAPPIYPTVAIEQTNPGSLYQSGAGLASLYQDPPIAHAIGDTLKIVIAEKTTASNKVTTSTSRKNAVATKGPGTTDDNLPGVVKNVLNLDANASGSDTFDGSGNLESTNSLKGQIAASVINVLPNGHLVVAGEKSIALDGSVSTLRFSGIVNPHDIKFGGVVNSTDVIDAHLEEVGRGDVADSNSRSRMQKLLTSWLSVW